MSWALVLSSGSKRGFAHAGALAALERNGLRPDMVVGSSAGALVGGIYASGAGAAEMAKLDVGRQFDKVFGLFARRASRSDTLRSFIEGHLRERNLERFPIPFAAVAARLKDGCLSLFRTGDAAQAIYASMSVPGFYVPGRVAGESYCDGGMVSPLPVRAARSLGAERVIALDVSFHPDWAPPSAFVDAMFYGPLLAVRNLAAMEADEADLVIRPRLPAVESIEKGNYAEVVAAGDRAIEESLGRIREALVARPVSTRTLEGDPRYCA